MSNSDVTRSVDGAPYTALEFDGRVDAQRNYARRMRRPRPLTEDLTISEGFSTRQALDNDVPSKRLRAGDLVAPHHGIRMSSRVLSPHDLDQSFASAGLIEGEVLADVSGARWWGLPLPRSLEEEMLTHVAVARPSHPPSGKRIVGHRLDPKRFVTAQLRGVQTLAPSSLLAHLAGRLELTQAVVFADALRTSFEHYPGRSNDVPVYSLEELSAVAQLWKGRPGAANLRAALELSRAGSESPKETELRLLIIGAGFREPTMQHKIYVPGYGKARIDLAYVREKIAIEFEGEGHFSDPAAARRDLERTEALQRAGWRVIRVTKADLRRPWNLLESIRLALAERAGLRA